MSLQNELKVLEDIDSILWEPDLSILPEDERLFLEEFQERFYAGYYKEGRNYMQLFKDGRKYKSILEKLKKHYREQFQR